MTHWLTMFTEEDWGMIVSGDSLSVKYPISSWETVRETSKLDVLLCFVSDSKFVGTLEMVSEPDTDGESTCTIQVRTLDTLDASDAITVNTNKLSSFNKSRLSGGQTLRKLNPYDNKAFVDTINSAIEALSPSEKKRLTKSRLSSYQLIDGTSSTDRSEITDNEKRLSRTDLQFDINRFNQGFL